MLLGNIPIRRKLITVIMTISSTVVLLTCVAFLVYEYITFKQSTISQFNTLSEITATNSTAALAFDSKDEAYEILSALKAEKQIIAACLYDSEGTLFSVYPEGIEKSTLPAGPADMGNKMSYTLLEGFKPVIEGERQLGTLYMKYDLSIMYDKLMLYLMIVAIVLLLSGILAYLLSRFMQKGISEPIMALAQHAKSVSEKKDYSVRATKTSNDELGSLTDAFNQMLSQIEKQNAALSSFNHKLEQKVEERTKELAAANKEMEAFSYSVSHDLRAPLRSMEGFLNLLKLKCEGTLDDEGQKYLDIILSSSRRMDQLIEDLLEFSKLGRKEVVKSHISMTNLVAEVWDELYKLEKDRDIELKMHDLPDAHADSATVKQIWVNLISNALKYSRKESKAMIEIGCEVKSGVPTYYITDNGAGFSMEYYSKLFNVFQRLHAQKDFDGTGVGLAIVQRITEKHGGKIWAYSKPGEGATFYFTLEMDPVTSPTLTTV